MAEFKGPNLVLTDYITARDKNMLHGSYQKRNWYSYCTKTFFEFIKKIGIYFARKLFRDDKVEIGKRDG